MRIVYLGTPEVAVPPLRTLVEAGHDVRLAITRPDRPVGRSGRPKPPPVKREAEAHGIVVEQPRKVRGPAFLELLRGADPEVLVVVAYGRILPRPVLEVAPHGAVNLHFSILPAYRGAAPVQWALARGETETGVTTMLIDEQMDEGDILLQRRVEIGPDEHAPELQTRLAETGCTLLLETLEGLEAGSLVPRPQDHARASLAPILTASDGEIGFDLTAAQIAGRVRGFDPWPGVWVRRGRSRLRIVDAVGLPGTVDDQPGRVLELTPEGLVVACGGGTRLALRRVQPEGRRVLAVRDAVNGRQIASGDLLEQWLRSDADA